MTFAAEGRLVFSNSLRIFWYLPPKQDIHLVKATYNRQFIQRQRSRKPGHMGTCAQAHLPCHKGREGTFLTNIHIFLTFLANIHIFLMFLANIHIFLTFFEEAHFKLSILLNFSYIPELTIQAHFE